MSPSEIIAIDISSDDESIIVLDDKDRNKGRQQSNEQAINKTSVQSRKRNSSKDVDGQPQNRKRHLMELELTSSPQLKMKKRSWPTSQETSDTTERRSIIRKKVTLDVDDSDADSADSYSSEVARYTSGYCNNFNEKASMTSSRQDEDEDEKRKLTLCVDDSSDDDSLVDDSSDVDLYSAKHDSLRRSSASIPNVHSRSDKENDSWNCTLCTFSNSMTDISCQICNGDPPFSSSRKHHADIGEISLMQGSTNSFEIRKLLVRGMLGVKIVNVRECLRICKINDESRKEFFRVGDKVLSVNDKQVFDVEANDFKNLLRKDDDANILEVQFAGDHDLSDDTRYYAPSYGHQQHSYTMNNWPYFAPHEQVVITDDPWFYIDHQGKIYGPFKGTEMRRWLEAGYLKGDILISQNQNGGFRPLASLFPHSSVAFQPTVTDPSEEELPQMEAAKQRAETEAREIAERADRERLMKEQQEKETDAETQQLPTMKKSDHSPSGSIDASKQPMQVEQDEVGYKDNSFEVEDDLRNISLQATHTFLQQMSILQEQSGDGLATTSKQPMQVEQVDKGYEDNSFELEHDLRNISLQVTNSSPQQMSILQEQSGNRLATASKQPVQLEDDLRNISLQATNTSLQQMSILQEQSGDGLATTSKQPMQVEQVDKGYEDNSFETSKAKNGSDHLVTNGVYSLFRHPNYTGECIGWGSSFMASIVAVIGTKSLDVAKSVAPYLTFSSLEVFGIFFVLIMAATNLETRQEEKYGTSPEYKAWTESSWSGPTLKK